MRRSLSFYLLGILCVLRASFATPTKVARDTRPVPKLRQTTRKEIKGRQESRTGLFYKRQSPSNVPVVYPTCPVTYSDLAVARYPATDILLGDVSLASSLWRQTYDWYFQSAMAFGAIYVINENARLQLCRDTAE
jgi:hypothetical protein